MIGETVSHYRILERLGAGGMGTVYLAEDTVLGRRVAIKTLTDVGPGSQHFRVRFLREARAVSTLSHPHIATIHDYGETPDGQPYIVMEFIKGETLADLMLKESLTIPRALEIISEVAEALGEAHHHGIIHRDIKPSNIAINQRGEVKVLDFGLAKQINPGFVDSHDPEGQTLLNTQTREGVIVGTPMYLSPEQALGVEVDRRSDLFSLGAVLYECLAGKPPFYGGSAVEICARVIRDDPPPPSQSNANISKELDRIALKALAKKQEARYQNADELITDLKEARAEAAGFHQTITRAINVAPGTHPTGALATLSDIFKRPRLSVGYVAAGILLIAIAVGSVSFLVRPKPHKPSAEVQRLYEVGTNAMRAGSFYQASKAFSVALQKDDNFALAHARLAEALMELDLSDKAKDELLRVSELTRDRSLFSPIDSLHIDAITYSARRDFPRAITAYTEIARLGPDQSQVHVDLGRAYEKNNQSEKAIASYIEATNRDSQNATAFLRLGILYGRQHNLAASNSAFEKAEAVYESLGDVEGRAEVAFQRGAVLNDIGGKVSAAREQLEQATQMAKVVNSQYQQIKILFQLSAVSFKEGNADRAQQYAREAVDLARTHQMESLIARGLIDLGNVYLARGEYSDAEKHFQDALGYAERFGGYQNKARAQLSLASVSVQRSEADRALAYVDQALAFYQTGGYRTETSQALLLKARIYKLKGDFKAALNSFRQQLQIATETGDEAQVAYSHNSLGNMLFDLESYSEALKHFEENYKINKSMGNQLYLGYALLNRGAARWHLGQYDEARSDLDQASVIAKKEGSAFQELQAFISLRLGEIRLRERNFSQAKIKAQEAIDLSGAHNKVVAVRGKYMLGLAQALAGLPRAGLKICQEAIDDARVIGDPLLIARINLAVAEAALAAGDFPNAISSSKRGQEFFSSAVLPESEWRAWLLHALAMQKSGDPNANESFSRAQEVLLSLRQKWGDEVFTSYMNRPSISEYSKQLGNSVTLLKTH